MLLMLRMHLIKFINHIENLLDANSLMFEAKGLLITPLFDQTLDDLWIIEQ